MHAADAIHGDLGMVQKEDVVIALSKSGDTPEIKVLVPLIKNMGNALIGLTGNPDSYLGTRADFVLNSFVQQEACPNNLAPTTSTTAQLVIGDAVAICLLEMRNFTSHDFAQYHPGGSLGKRLYLTVGDLYTQNERPVVQIGDGMKTIIMEISARRLGMTAVQDGDVLCGIITDGDLRRMLEREVNIQTITAREIMTPDPKTIPSDMLAAEALEIMEKMNITQLLVVDEGVYKGVIHLHDIIKEGIL
jgi:arabinose-5-phosphate isomerase